MTANFRNPNRNILWHIAQKVRYPVAGARNLDLAISPKFTRMCELFKTAFPKSLSK